MHQSIQVFKIEAIFLVICLLFLSVYQGDVAAELMVNHARSSECHDIEQFKADMTILVQEAHRVTLQLGQVGIVEATCGHTKESLFFQKSCISKPFNLRF